MPPWSPVKSSGGGSDFGTGLRSQWSELLLIPDGSLMVSPRNHGAMHVELIFQRFVFQYVNQTSVGHYLTRLDPKVPANQSGARIPEETVLKEPKQTGSVSPP